MNKNDLIFVAIECDSINGSYVRFERVRSNKSYKVDYKRENWVSNLINNKDLVLLSTHVHPNSMRIAYYYERGKENE